MILDKKIRVFKAIADCGSFSDASRVLSLSQSVVSFHLDSLEKELGITLFKRMGRTIELTDIGKKFYEKIKKINFDIKKIEEEISFFTREISKKIFLAGNSLTCAFTLPIALSIFQKKNPNIIYSYNFQNQNDILDNLLNERLDIAFVGHKIINKKIENSECFKDEIVLVTNSNFKNKTIKLSDIKNLLLVWIKGDIGLELVLKQELQKKGISLNNLNIFMEVEDLSIAKNLIKNGIVSAFLPRLTVKDELEFGMLKIVDIENLNIERTTFHSYLKDKKHRPIFKNFLDFLTNDEWKNKIIENF